MSKCGAVCEVYSRVCGYFRPVSNWNKGKKEEFMERKVFHVPGTLVALLALLALLVTPGCTALESKAVAIGSGVDAFKLETTGSIASGTLLPNLILGGATNTLATAPVIVDGGETQVVFVRSRRRGFFGQHRFARGDGSRNRRALRGLRQTRPPDGRKNFRRRYGIILLFVGNIDFLLR